MCARRRTVPIAHRETAAGERDHPINEFRLAPRARSKAAQCTSRAQNRDAVILWRCRVRPEPSAASDDTGATARRIPEINKSRDRETERLALPEQYPACLPSRRSAWMNARVPVRTVIARIIATACACARLP
jgi:hypothetical protein